MIVKVAVIIAVIAVLIFCAVVALGLCLVRQLDRVGDIFDPWQ